MQSGLSASEIEREIEFAKSALSLYQTAKHDYQQVTDSNEGLYLVPKSISGSHLVPVPSLNESTKPADQYATLDQFVNQALGQTASSYERQGFKDDFNNYMANEGDFLQNYLSNQGRSIDHLAEVDSIKLPDSVLAQYQEYKTPSGKKLGAIVSNGGGQGFNSRAARYASQFKTTVEVTKKYIITHELMHAAGYKSESDCDTAVAKFYNTKAAMSTGQEQTEALTIAKMASVRAAQYKSQSCSTCYKAA